MTILIVDDDQNWLDILSRLLEKDGFSVDLAKDSTEAENKLKSTKYKLLITDVRLQEIHLGRPISEKDAINRQEGIRVLNLAKRYNSSIRTIIITGYAEQVKVDSIECDYFFEKPFHFDNNTFRKLVIDLIGSP